MRTTAKLLLIGLMSLGLNAMAQDLEHSGYVYGKYQMNNGLLKKTATAGIPNTFSSGGAVKLSKKMDGGEFLVDIPISQNATSGTHNLSAGTAQAYIRHSYDFGLTWTLGQFDTFVGAESNDTNELFFVNQSIHYAALPTSHTGAHFEYGMGAINLGFMLANGLDKGTQATTENTQMGLNLGWENDMIGVNFGYITTKIVATAESQNLMDLVVDWNGGPWGVAFEYTSVGNVGGNKNAETISGIMLQATYDLNDESGVAFRYNQVDKAPSSLFGIGTPGTAFDSKKSAQSQIGLAYNHMLTKDLKAKAEVTSNTLDVDGTNSDNWMAGALAAVYSF